MKARDAAKTLTPFQSTYELACLRWLMSLKWLTSAGAEVMLMYDVSLPKNGKMKTVFALLVLGSSAIAFVEQVAYRGRSPFPNYGRPLDSFSGENGVERPGGDGSLGRFGEGNRPQRPSNGRPNSSEALRVETVHKDRQMEEAPGTDPAVLTVDTGHNVLPLGKTMEVDLGEVRVEDFLEIPMDEVVPNFQTLPNRRAALLAETVHKDRAVMDQAMGIDHKDRLMKEEDPTTPRTGTGLKLHHQGVATGAVPTALGLETVHKDRQMEEAAETDSTTPTMGGLQEIQTNI
ncbi:unnamed protein product [Nippostrongylus brasiliensis]|uniref:Secreted protein n=1 Tax=Nippostrongylus brasiliensis TaxID=27835 RepID=A0A0N4YAP9_NIPBR|nr:unnamed protein product [Nippostrongylus brasiliensis]